MKGRISSPEDVDLDYTLIGLVNATVHGNEYMTIKQHLEVVEHSFRIVEKSLKSNKFGPYTNPNIMNCPLHGWVFCIKRMYANRCPKCFRKRYLYRKRRLAEDAANQ